MGFQVDDDTTPKLTLSKIPYCKPREPPRNMKTPPLRSSVSIPFRWEEEPGKPRATLKGQFSCSRNRCLELPPRLLHDDPSPTTVLEGPYVGRSLSLACTFSFRKRSARWGSFRDEAKLGKGNFDIPHSSLGDIFKSEDNDHVKATGVKRKRRTFFSMSTINTNYSWADIYASVKQAVSWRRRSKSCSF